MIAWLYRMIVGAFPETPHQHVWDEKERGYISHGEKVVGRAFLCRCRGCGEWKKFELLIESTKEVKP